VGNSINELELFIFYGYYYLHHIMSYFKNKKVWITGASAGIGRALALALAAEGAHLILSSRKLEALTEVKTECSQSPGVQVVKLDLEDHEGLESIFRDLSAFEGI